MNRDDNYKLPDNIAIAVEPVLGSSWVYTFNNDYFYIVHKFLHMTI